MYVDIKKYFKTIDKKPSLSRGYSKAQMENFISNCHLPPGKMDYIIGVNQIELNSIRGLRELTGYRDKKFDVFKLLDLIAPKDFNKCMKFIDSSFNLTQKFKSNPLQGKVSLIYRIKEKGGTERTVLREASCGTLNDKGELTSHYSLITDMPFLRLHKAYAWYTFEGQKHPINLVDDINISFTKREYEILYLLSQGLTSYAIADSLFISLHTVNTHKRNMFAKANAKNVVQLLEFAYEYDIINRDLQ